MTYEVELKFPVEDPKAILPALHQQRGKAMETIQQKDTYFAHPQRDFGQTDEAFRLRCMGEENRVTYKGPLLDQETKSRREIEFSFQSGQETFQQFSEMLNLLGFRPVRSVEKQRTPYHLDWEGRDVEVVLDNVTGLGHFVELECTADDDTLDDVRQSLLRLADQFGLKNQQRKSYLCLLLDKESSG